MDVPLGHKVACALAGEVVAGFDLRRAAHTVKRVQVDRCCATGRKWCAVLYATEARVPKMWVVQR
jgi:hypothetical protein